MNLATLVDLTMRATWIVLGAGLMAVGLLAWRKGRRMEAEFRSAGAAMDPDSDRMQGIRSAGL